MLERWTDVTRFVDDPCINSTTLLPSWRCGGGAGRCRKNHYGSKSLRGTQVAALFYLLCETGQLTGVDPHAYLLHAVEAALARPGTVTLSNALLLAASA
jgi:transposase